MIDWLTSLDVQIQTGLIAAVATLIGIALKDFVLQKVEERNKAKRLALDVYRNYADPIASAASSLFWRLREILVNEGRGSFLKTSGSDTQFDRYKYESTLYRLAAMIAWLRAYRRELTFFSLSDADKLSSLRDSINSFEKALSDGDKVEVQRVRSISELWDIPLPSDKSELSAVGVAVEQVLKSELHANNADLASSLNEGVQMRLCRSVADTLTSRMRIDPIEDKIVQETLHRAVLSLSIREAWVYRDFQSGIGDLMIQRVSGGARQYEVIGFGDFEDILLSGEEKNSRWISRLNRIVDRLDVSGADRYDARVQLLEETFLSTIRLLCVLAQIDPRRGSVAPDALAEGERLLRDQSWRKKQRS